MGLRWIGIGGAAFCVLVAVDAGRDSQAGIAWWVLACVAAAAGFWWMKRRALLPSGPSYEESRWAPWAVTAGAASVPFMEAFFEKGQLVLLGGVSGGLVALAIWVRPRAAA
jgi:hypothetical protein